MRDYREIITLVPGRRSGKPTVRGTRITVADVLGYLAAGMSEDEILADFPELTREDLRACLAFAAERERVEVEPQAKPRYTLSELVAQCDPEAPASDEDAVWLADEPTGKEAV